jgi:hypothetical protein
MGEDYLIWSNEHRAWWGPGHHGYVRELSRAGRYSRPNALDICRKALGTAGHMGMLAEIPVLESDVQEFLRGALVPLNIL